MSEIINSVFANIDPENDKFVNKNVDIVEEIHRVLDERGMNQKDLAKLLKKSTPELSKWLTGMHNLTLRSITKLEVALGTDIIMTCKEAQDKFERTDYVLVNKDALLNNVESTEVEQVPLTVVKPTRTLQIA